MSPTATTLISFWIIKFGYSVQNNQSKLMKTVAVKLKSPQKQVLPFGSPSFMLWPAPTAITKDYILYESITIWTITKRIGYKMTDRRHTYAI